MRPSTRLLLAGLLASAAATMYGQPPTTGAQWWSTDPNLNCTSFHSLVHEISLASGGQGYACGVTGSFIWSAAGGNWRTSIRMSAPASGAVGVQYIFYDQDGKRISVDTISGSARAAGDTVGLALNANQSSEVQLLGASSDGPQHGRTQTGSVFALLLCPDAGTCATVVPQLVYSSLPFNPWLLSVPIAWDNSFSFLQPSGLARRWSATGIHSDTDRVSFAIYNQSLTSATYTVRVYDSTGALAGQGVTPPIPGGNGVDSAGGTRGFLLTDVIGTPIPAGVVKVTIEGAGPISAIFLQFSGESATSLPATPDVVPVTSSSTATIRHPHFGVSQYHGVPAMSCSEYDSGACDRVTRDS